MAHAKNHDYHILAPSWNPFIGSVGAFVMLFGAVLWMQGSAPWMFFIGLAVVLYVMFSWWSEVVVESHQGDHTPVVQIGLRYGVILFIMSEVMFFSAWFWSFFKHAMYPMGPDSPAIDGVWPPVGIETFDPWHLPLINTLILLCSGMAATWAHHAIAHENNRKDLINGLALAVERLRGQEALSKVAILLTDGVSNAGDITPSQAADLAAASDVKVYCIGAGTRGVAPFPGVDPFTGRTYLRRMPVEIDEKTLKEIARKTGGRYFRATDEDSMSDIYREIDQLERTEISERRYLNYHEKYLPFTIAALVLLFSGCILGNSLLRRLP